MVKVYILTCLSGYGSVGTFTYVVLLDHVRKQINKHELLTSFAVKVIPYLGLPRDKFRSSFHSVRL